MKCALCQNKSCTKGKICTHTNEKISLEYVSNNQDMLKGSSYIPNGFSRINEIIQFAKYMEYKKIGIAFCIAMYREAEIIHKMLEKHFEVFSVICKIGGIDKDEFDIPKFNENIHETTCNPIGQAFELNELNTDLNVLVGLCIGHDILFTQQSKAPTTTLIVKDRLYRHNPIKAFENVQ